MEHPFETDAPSLSRKALDDTSLLSGAYWSELRTFLALAKAGSLSRAADILGVSHTTVARDVRRLQDVLGSQLAVISKAGAKLTDRGGELAKQLVRFDRELHVLARDIGGEQHRTEGVVRVSITDGLGVIFVAPALRRLHREYPGIKVHLKTPQNFRSFAENQTDCMVAFAPDPSPGVMSTTLGWLHFLPICSESYLDRRGLPSRDNIAAHEFIDSEQYSARNGVWRHWQDLVSRGRVSYCCDASITYGMLVKSGLGIGLLGNYNILEPAAVPLDLGVRVSLPLYALAHVDRLSSRPVRIVYDFLCDLFSPSQHWFTREMRLEALRSGENDGYAMLFNLPG